jgi:hypothetical protein
MKRDRSSNDDQTEFSLKRFGIENKIAIKDTKQSQSHLKLNRTDLNLFDKRHIIDKVQLWLDNIRSTNR